jgi:tetratricopeptide (TPR) repeat protein
MFLSLRFTNKRLFFQVFFVCYFTIIGLAQAKPADFHVVNSGTLKAGAGHIIHTGNFSSAGMIRVSVNGVVIHSRSTIGIRGLGGIFYLAPFKEVSIVEVSIKRDFKVNLAFTAFVKIYDHLSFGDSEWGSLISLDASFSRWEKNIANRNVNVLNDVASELLNLEPEHLLELELIPMLVALSGDAGNPNLPQLPELNVKVGGVKSDVASRILREFDLHQQWDELNKLEAQQQRAEAQEKYLALLTDMDNDQSYSKSWHLNREKIRCTAANSALLYSYFSNKPEFKERGHKLAKQTLAWADRHGADQLLGYVQNVLALYHLTLDQTPEAIKYLSDAIQTHYRIGMSVNAISPLSNLAQIYNRQGRNQEAIALLARALEIEPEFDAQDLTSDLKLNLADLYFDVGDYLSALREAKAVYGYYFEVNNTTGMASAAMLKGRSYRELGQFFQAISAHTEALNFYEGVGSEASSVSASTARIELAKDYISAGRMSEAKLLVANNISIQSKLQDQDGGNAYGFIPEEIAAYLVIAKVSQLEFDVINFDIAVSHLHDLFDKEGNTDAYPIEKLELQAIKLDYYIRKNDRAKVELELEAALQLIEGVRAGLDLNNLGLSWSGKANRILGSYVDFIASTGFESNKKELFPSLFNFLEQYQALNVRTNRRMSKSDESKVTLSLRAKEALNRALVFERNAVNAVDTEEREQALSSAKEARSIYQSHVAHSRPVLDPPELVGITIERVQSKLRPDELLLKYYVRNDLSFVFVVTKDTWAAHKLPAKKSLSLKIREYLGLLASRGAEELIHDTEFVKSLGIDGIAFDDFSKLILMPDDVLHGLPFSTINMSDVGEFYSPLGGKVEIVRTVSIADYFAVDVPIAGTQGVFDIAIFADPVFGISAKEYTFSKKLNFSDGFRDWSKNLKRLPWTGREAESIQRTFTRKSIYTMLREDATSSALVSKEALNSKVLHIASHGYFNSNTPSVVGIATTPTIDQLGSGAGFVTLTELLSKKINSNLVVVSGCETALGEKIEGEGLNGLARGMISQGAGSVIATLWSIPDKPTAKFMKELYLNLEKADGNIASALTQTQRNFLSSDRYSHPFYWSGFVLTSAAQQYDQNVFE